MVGWVKLLHVACATVSVTFFVVRALWMLQGSSLLNALWVRVAPHVVDTVLFLSGVYLASLWGWPTWVYVKLVGVVLYIVFGSLALRRAPTALARRVSLLAALVAVSFVFMVAFVGRFL